MHQYRGEYGDPWDTAIGINWSVPSALAAGQRRTSLSQRFAVPVYSSIPYAVGGDGPVLNTNVEMKF